MKVEEDEEFYINEEKQDFFEVEDENISTKTEDLFFGKSSIPDSNESVLEEVCTPKLLKTLKNFNENETPKNKLPNITSEFKFSNFEVKDLNHEATQSFLKPTLASKQAKDFQFSTPFNNSTQTFFHTSFVEDSDIKPPESNLLFLKNLNQKNSFVPSSNETTIRKRMGLNDTFEEKISKSKKSHNDNHNNKDDNNKELFKFNFNLANLNNPDNQNIKNLNQENNKNPINQDLRNLDDQDNKNPPNPDKKIPKFENLWQRFEYFAGNIIEIQKSTEKNYFNAMNQVHLLGINLLPEKKCLEIYHQYLRKHIETQYKEILEDINHITDLLILTQTKSNNLLVSPPVPQELLVKQELNLIKKKSIFSKRRIYFFGTWILKSLFGFWIVCCVYTMIYFFIWGKFPNL